MGSSDAPLVTVGNGPIGVVLTVLPVLVDATPMFTMHELPADPHGMLATSAVAVASHDLDASVERVVTAIRHFTPLPAVLQDVRAGGLRMRAGRATDPDRWTGLRAAGPERGSCLHGRAGSSRVDRDRQDLHAGDRDTADSRRCRCR